MGDSKEQSSELGILMTSDSIASRPNPSNYHLSKVPLNFTTMSYPLDSGGIALVRAVDIVRTGSDLDASRSARDGLGFTLRRCYLMPPSPSSTTLAPSEGLAEEGGAYTCRKENKASPKPDCMFVKHVKAGSLADEANLLVGDIILSINDLDVSQCTYEQVIAKIQSSGPSLNMKVLTSERCWPYIRQPYDHAAFGGSKEGGSREGGKVASPNPPPQTVRGVGNFPSALTLVTSTAYMPILNAYPCYKARLTTYQPEARPPKRDALDNITNKTQRAYPTQPPNEDDGGGGGEAVATFHHPDKILERMNELLKSVTSIPRKVDAKLYDSMARVASTNTASATAPNSRQFWLSRVQGVKGLTTDDDRIEEGRNYAEDRGFENSFPTDGADGSYYGFNDKRRLAIDAAKRAFLAKVSRSSSTAAPRVPPDRPGPETLNQITPGLPQPNELTQPSTPGARRASYILATSDGTLVAQNMLSHVAGDSYQTTPQYYNEAPAFRPGAMLFHPSQQPVGYVNESLVGLYSHQQGYAATTAGLGYHQIGAKKPYSRHLRERMKRFGAANQSTYYTGTAPNPDFSHDASAAAAASSNRGHYPNDPFIARFPEGISDEWPISKGDQQPHQYQPAEPYNYNFAQGPNSFEDGRDRVWYSEFKDRERLQVPPSFYDHQSMAVPPDALSLQYSYSKTKSKSQMALSPNQMLKSPTPYDDLPGSLKRFASTNLKQISPVLNRDANVPSTTFLTASNKNIFASYQLLGHQSKSISSSANGTLTATGGFQKRGTTVGSPEKRLDGKSSSLQNIDVASAFDNESSTSQGGLGGPDGRPKYTTWKSSKMVRSLKEKFSSILPHNRMVDHQTRGDTLGHGHFLLSPPNEKSSSSSTTTTARKSVKQHQKLFANIADHFTDSWSFAGGPSSSYNGETSLVTQQQHPFGTAPNKIQGDSATFDHTLEEANLAKTDPFVPSIVEKCIELIETYGLYNVGVYRVPGNNGAVSALIREFDKNGDGANVWCDQKKWRDVNVVASILKTYFRRLADPLLTNDFYSTLIEANRLSVTEERLITLKKFIRMLPDYHFRTLKFLMAHLHNLASKSAINRMDSRNLAIVFGPTLVRKSNNDVASMVRDMPDQCKIVESLITRYKWFFEEGINSPFIPDNDDTNITKDKYDDEKVLIKKLTPTRNEINPSMPKESQSHDTHQSTIASNYSTLPLVKQSQCQGGRCEFDGTNTHPLNYTEMPVIYKTSSCPLSSNRCNTDALNLIVPYHVRAANENRYNVSPSREETYKDQYSRALPRCQPVSREGSNYVRCGESRREISYPFIHANTTSIIPPPRDSKWHGGEYARGKVLGSEENILSSHENDSGFGTLPSAGEYVHASLFRPSIPSPYPPLCTDRRGHRLAMTATDFYPTPNPTGLPPPSTSSNLPKSQGHTVDLENGKSAVPHHHRKSFKDKNKPHTSHSSPISLSKAIKYRLPSYTCGYFASQRDSSAKGARHKSLNPYMHTCDSGNHSGSSSREGDVSELDTTPNMGKIRKDYFTQNPGKQPNNSSHYSVNNTSISSKVYLPKQPKDHCSSNDRDKTGCAHTAVSSNLKCGNEVGEEACDSLSKPKPINKGSGFSKAKSLKQLSCYRRNSLTAHDNSSKSSSSPDFSHPKQGNSKGSKKRILRRHTVIGGGNLPLITAGYGSSRSYSKKYSVAQTITKPKIVKSETFCEGHHGKKEEEVPFLQKRASKVDPTYCSSSQIPLPFRSVKQPPPSDSGRAQIPSPPQPITDDYNKQAKLVRKYFKLPSVLDNFETLLKSNKYMESAV